MYKRKEIIGNCTLYLGNSIDIVPTLGKIDAIVTDPPFGMNFQSNYKKHKHLKIENDDSTNLLKWTTNIDCSHSKYIFCRWDNLYDVKKPKSLITWVKNNHSMGDLKHEHGRQTEVCLFYPSDGHFFPKERPNDVIKFNRTGNALHPTEKPVGLMQMICSYTDGIILDPFMGSGTTGVACLKINKYFIGIEIEEKYFDIACKRIEKEQKQPNDMFGF